MEKDKEHRIFTKYGRGDRAYWECDCGSSGSAPEYTVDIASDKHIKPGEHRIDVSRPHY